MDFGKFGNGKVVVKIECDNFSEALQIDAVKSEIPEIDIFTNSSRRRSGEFVYHKHADSYHEQNEEKIEVNNLDSEDLGISKLSENLRSEYNTVQIKEDDIDILYEDIKKDTGEDKSSESITFCDVCNQSFGRETDFLKSPSYISECNCQKQNESLFHNIHGEDMTFDVKPSSPDLKTDSGLQPLKVENEISRDDEVIKEQDSSAIPRKPSAPRKRKLRSKPQINLSEQKEKSHCNFCPKSFSSVGALKIHEKEHTGKNLFDCEICFKPFLCKSRLKTHLRIHTGEKSFQCKICSKSFSQKANLQTHEVGHTSEKLFHCRICSKSFARMGSLKVHERLHTSEKRFYCQICPKSYSRMDSLKVHVRDHNCERPSFHCNTCSKSFIRMSTIKLHEKIHAGEKPFQCKICFKSFPTSNQLTYHEMIHGEKSFHCKTCSKSFSLMSNLRVHERGHTGDKPFGCKICSKAFYTSSSLRKHSRIHTGK